MNSWFRVSRAVWRLVVVITIFLLGGWTAACNPHFSWGLAASIAVSTVISSFVIWFFGRKSGPTDSSSDDSEEEDS